MAKADKAIKQRTKAAIKSLNEDVASWEPRPKGWPEINQRVRLIGAHPWAGHTGLVIAFHEISLFPEEGPKPVVSLDADYRCPNGQTCFILQSDQWERAE
jgi:hypothetical protein